MTDSPHKIQIIESGTRPASSFQGNPRNWRKHPDSQREAVAASLRELGWIAPVIENKRTGHLIDGHERVWQALQNGDEDVPYVLVDLSERKEHLALTIFDPIGALADTDREVLSGLIDDVKTGEAALQGLIEDMAEANDLLDVPNFDPVGIDEQGKLDERSPVTCPECGHAFAP